MAPDSPSAALLFSNEPGACRAPGPGCPVHSRGAGTFKGNSGHEVPSTCVNSIVDFEGATCNLL